MEKSASSILAALSLHLRNSTGPSFTGDTLLEEIAAGIERLLEIEKGGESALFLLQVNSFILRSRERISYIVLGALDFVTKVMFVMDNARYQMYNPVPCHCAFA